MENYNINKLITMLEDLHEEYIRSHWNYAEKDVRTKIRACIEYAEELKDEPILARVIDQNKIYPIHMINYETKQVTLIVTKKTLFTVALKRVELIRKGHL